jgi:hypothetical protein
MRQKDKMGRKPITKEYALELYRKELDRIDAVYYEELGKIGKIRSQAIEKAEKVYWVNYKNA